MIEQERECLVDWRIADREAEHGQCGLGVVDRVDVGARGDVRGSRDVAGEGAVQAVTMAQLGSGLGAVILSGALLNSMLFAPQDMERRMEAIVHGWRLGKSLRPLFGADWASMLTWPLARVREHFGMRAEDVQVPAMAA